MISDVSTEEKPKIVVVQASPVRRCIRHTDSAASQILNQIKLPVKSLIRLRCVSKSCNSTITNPIFITTHFNLNKAKSLPNNNNHNGYLLYAYKACNLPPNSYQEWCAVVCNTDRTFTEISKFKIPFSDARMIGYCNGILCFYIYRYENTYVKSRNYSYRDDYKIFLWNPSIKKLKMVLDTHLTTTDAHGFAYHSQNNDFKILRIFHYLISGEKAKPAEAEVYMLSTDSWRTVGPLSGSIVEIEDDFVFVDGALYYLARNTEGRKFILSFDVNDERFREIMLPDDYLGDFSPHFCNFELLAVFKGLLALVAFGTDLDEEDLCIIWVMREYGVVESWTLYTVPVDYVEMFYGFTDNGELLIEVKSGIVSFDPDSLNENNLGI